MLLWCSRRCESNGVGKYLLMCCLWPRSPLWSHRGFCVLMCPAAVGERTVGSAGTWPSWGHCHPGHQSPFWERFTVSPCQRERQVLVDLTRRHMAVSRCHHESFWGTHAWCEKLDSFSVNCKSLFCGEGTLLMLRQ